MKDLIVKNVDIFGDTIMAAMDKDGNIWVGVKWVCDGLGMTEGQTKRQIKNIQKDMLFRKGGSNQIHLPTKGGIQDVFCIRNDFVPLWLAKIVITEKTRDERPEFAEKLMKYQLKAKDILASAFIQTNQHTKTNHNTRDIPVGEIARLSSVMDRIMVRQESQPHEIAGAFEALCRQFGIVLPDYFVNVPQYEQLKLEFTHGYSVEDI